MELIIAISLSSLAFASLASLTGSATRHQIQGMNTLSAEMNSSLAFKAVEREMSQATLLLAPAAPGLKSGALEACANAAGPGAPSQVDPGQPMRFFAFCQIGTTLYYHSRPGCPAAYTCGNAASSSYGNGKAPVIASFLRPSAYSPVVEISVTATSQGTSTSRNSSFAVAAAAGRNQSP
jgi:hypothetical protein